MFFLSVQRRDLNAQNIPIIGSHKVVSLVCVMGIPFSEDCRKYLLLEFHTHDLCVVCSILKFVFEFLSIILWYLAIQLLFSRQINQLAAFDKFNPRRSRLGDLFFSCVEIRLTYLKKSATSLTFLLKMLLPAIYEFG